MYSDRCKHIPVDDDRVSTGARIQVAIPVEFASAGICRSRGVPAMSPYLTNQNCWSEFHLPPAALILARKDRSEAGIRTGN